MPRFAFSEPSIGSSTTRVGSPPSPLAELLGDERERRARACSASSRATTAASAAASIAVVSSPPWPAPTHRLAVGARRQLRRARARTSTTRRRGELEPVRSQLVEEQAREQLGIEVGALLRHPSARRGDRAHLLDRRRAQQERRLRLAAVDERDCLVRARRVARARRCRAARARRVELALAGASTSASPRSVDEERGLLVVDRAEPGSAPPAGCAESASAGSAVQLGQLATTRCVGKMISPSPSCRRTTTITSCASGAGSSARSATAVS